MAGRDRPYYPPQENIPSQRVPGRTPYAPGQPQAAQVAQQQQPHPQAPGAPPKYYVVSTFDARPINGIDFQAQSGNDNRDTGYLPDAIAVYFEASCFYTVGSGRVAIVRDFQVLAVPQQGEPIAGELTANPIFTANGASNFKLTVSFFVDGNPQEGMSPINTWALPFGDYFGECYIVAEEGQTIEMRVQGTDTTGSQFYQALLAFHGNLLLSQGLQAEYEPATNAVLPVQNQGAS